MDSFADLIARHLDAWLGAGHSQAELGRIVELNPSNLSHMRAGRFIPGHDLLALLCDALGTTEADTRALFAAANRRLPAVLGSGNDAQAEGC